MSRMKSCFLLLQVWLWSLAATGGEFDIAHAPAPLFRDPLFDGPADPTVIYDSLRRIWVIYYTQRKASDLTLGNRSWSQVALLFIV